MRKEIPSKWVLVFLEYFGAKQNGVANVVLKGRAINAEYLGSDVKWTDSSDGKSFCKASN